MGEILVNLRHRLSLSRRFGSGFTSSRWAQLQSPSHALVDPRTKPRLETTLSRILTFLIVCEEDSSRRRVLISWLKRVKSSKPARQSGDDIC